MNAVARVVAPSLSPDPASDGLVAANGPDVDDLHEEVERLRTTLVDLRSPAGAVRMAVQILRGPLRRVLDRLDPKDRTTTTAVLDALETSTEQVCDLLRSEAGPAVVRSSRVRPKVAPEPPTREIVADPPTKSRAPVDVAKLLARLEIMTVTRSSEPVLLAVDVDPGLQACLSGSDLLRALAFLVENAVTASSKAAPDQSPWTIDIRAYEDPSEVLGDEVDLVFEVRDRGDGVPDEVAHWLEAPQASDAPPGRGLLFVKDFVRTHGGEAEVARVRDQTVVRLRFPQDA